MGGFNLGVFNTVIHGKIVCSVPLNLLSSVCLHKLIQTKEESVDLR